MPGFTARPSITRKGVPRWRIAQFADFDLGEAFGAAGVALCGPLDLCAVGRLRGAVGLPSVLLTAVAFSFGSPDTGLRIRIRIARQANWTDLDRIRQDLRRANRKSPVFSLGKTVRWIPLAAVLFLLAAPSPFADPTSPRETLLNEARQLAWLNNWAEAARVLQQLDRSRSGPHR